MEKDSPELYLGPGLISTSMLSNIKKVPYSQLTVHKLINVKKKKNAKAKMVVTLWTLGFKWIKADHNIGSDSTILQSK